MERTLSQEERLKRAEEIYYRRQKPVNLDRTTTVNVNSKKNYILLKKIIIQIIICALIYGAIYKMQSNTDSFSIDSISYLKGAIAYDVDINKAINNIKNHMSIFNLEGNENSVEVNNVVQDNITIEDATTSNTMQEATLAASEQIIENIIEPKEEASSISEIGENSEYIKSNFSFIKPLTTGTVTSRFGIRNPSTETVPKYHTGIDIGVPEGTVFVASMEGTVELVSSVGDYRKPCENNKRGCNSTICTL